MFLHQFLKFYFFRLFGISSLLVRRLVVLARSVCYSMCRGLKFQSSKNFKMSDLFIDSKLFRGGLYVAALLASFGCVFWKVFAVSRASRGVFFKYLLVPVIGVVSVVVVWRNILMFLMEMVKDYLDLKTMFKETDVIVEVYVCWELNGRKK